MKSFSQWLSGLTKDPLSSFRYGHYCGPGPKLNATCDALADGSPMPHPKNQVDAACRIHDLAYCKCGANWTNGLPIGGTSCTLKADKDLIHNISGLDLQGSEKTAADTIKGYFRLTTGLNPFVHARKKQ